MGIEPGHDSRIEGRRQARTPMCARMRSIWAWRGHRECGPAQGSYDAESGVYEVHARDAHAWPEVFFPGFGCLELEPTASQPPLIRPEAAQGAGAVAAGEGGEAREGEPFRPGLEPPARLALRPPAC